MIDRRQFLKALTAGSVAGTQFGLGGTALSAYAGDSSGYKALVCVFLFGGLDNHDFLLPTDASNYNSFAQIRQSMLAVAALCIENFNQIGHENNMSFVEKRNGEIL